MLPTLSIYDESKHDRKLNYGKTFRKKETYHHLEDFVLFSPPPFIFVHNDLVKFLGVNVLNVIMKEWMDACIYRRMDTITSVHIETHPRVERS